MASKIISIEEARKTTKKQRRIVTFFDNLELYLERKEVNMKIRKARRHGKDTIQIDYCISDILKEELIKEGYKVNAGCMCVAGIRCPYTFISL